MAEYKHVRLESYHQGRLVCVVYLDQVGDKHGQH